jgi:Sodium:solute symporter family
VVGVAISIGTAYLVMDFKGIMDYVQALFSFFIAPLFATVLLGMLWKRATPAGGFWGLLAGTGSSVGMWAWVKVDLTALRYVALSPLWSCLTRALVTVVISLLTKPKESYVTLLHRAVVLGGGGGSGVRDREFHFLVRRYATRRRHFHLVFHRHLAAGERRDDPGLGPLRTLSSAPGAHRVLPPPRQHLVGRYPRPHRRGLLRQVFTVFAETTLTVCLGAADCCNHFHSRAVGC